MQNQESDLRNFTRGGQIFLHNFRMVKQIIYRVLVFCAILYFILLFTWIFWNISIYELYLCGEWLGAKFISLIKPDALETIRQPDGSMVQVYSYQIVNSPLINEIINSLVYILAQAIVWPFLICTIVFFIVYRWFRFRGHHHSETKKLRGDDIADKSVVKKLIMKSKKVSTLKISGLALPENFETGHILIHGTTGSGKSVCIRELLDQIRQRGDRAIIYDKSCDYVKSYCREGKDIILNPLDERTASWHLWDECRDSADYDSIAAALMPMPPGATDPFWINAARTIFSAAARQMQTQHDRSIINLLKSLLTSDLGVMEEFLRGTEAESLVSEKIEKTAISIKSVLATYLKSLKYVKDGNDAFSIRKWVQDDTQSNWLFISSLADRHETLKPLISMWLDIASNALMSLTPSYSRRIWLIFDELPSLHKLPYLPEAFAESRKFGGCLVAGMQSIAQLRKIYGNNAAEEISGLCNTRIFFREPSSETAAWVSRELGQSEIEEVREGISYGESSMRSGISISNQNHQKQIVSTSEIMRLDNLSAYIRLPGSWPITKIQFDYKKPNEITRPYIARPLDESGLRDVDQLIKKYQAASPLTESASTTQYQTQRNEQCDEQKQPSPGRKKSKTKDDKLNQLDEDFQLLG